MKILIEDFKRYKNYKNITNILVLYISSRAFQSVVLYRLSNFCYRNNMKKFSIILKNKSIKKTGCEIGEGAKIGKGLRVSHPVGIVISGGANIGNNVTIQSGVVIGTNREEIDVYPRIGDNVYIGAGAKILGDITIGDNVNIGANAVVLKNIESNNTVVGIPAKPVR